jgi:hypothetical protein
MFPLFCDTACSNFRLALIIPALVEIHGKVDGGRFPAQTCGNGNRFFPGEAIAIAG